MYFRYFHLIIVPIFEFSLVDTMENENLLLKEESQIVLAEDFDIRITKFVNKNEVKCQEKHKLEVSPPLSTHEESSNENLINNGTELSTLSKSKLDEVESTHAPKVKTSKNLDDIEKSYFVNNKSNPTKKKMICPLPVLPERPYIKTEDKFHCANCNKPFLAKSALYRHYRKAHMDIIYRCDHCIYETKDKYSLTEHVKVQHLGKGLNVNTVNKHFSHVMKKQYIHKVHEHLCDKCDSAFVQYWQLELHIKVGHEGKGQEHFCNICMKMILKLEEHRDKIHGPPKTFPCKKCKAEFDSKKLLRNHKHKPVVVRYY